MGESFVSPSCGTVVIVGVSVVPAVAVVVAPFFFIVQVLVVVVAVVMVDDDGNDEDEDKVRLDKEDNRGRTLLGGRPAVASAGVAAVTPTAPTSRVLLEVTTAHLLAMVENVGRCNGSADQQSEINRRTVPDGRFHDDRGGRQCCTAAI
jgi:hypothetical protein